ncbi:MAG: hypothetical protein HQM10_26290 [Candidatus Riflebacteria bacterium]|nr:hypothetical protein [Candidatus Riflebacteria bacterium]
MKICRFVFLLMFSCVALIADNTSNYPGSAVVDQTIKNIEKCQTLLRGIAAQKELKDRAIKEIESLLQTSKLHVEYLADILKNNQPKCPSSKNSNVSYEFECKGCGGSDGSCKACGGDGVVWCPSFKEYPCGQCKCTGRVNFANKRSLICTGCGGSGWAHSKPNPPDGWSAE